MTPKEKARAEARKAEAEEIAALRKEAEALKTKIEAALADDPDMSEIHARVLRHATLSAASLVRALTPPDA